MRSKSLDILDKLKELRNLSSETSEKLEIDGLSITNIPKEQLFAYNIKSIISSVEALLRNEPSEKPFLRLEKDIPDAFVNLKKLKDTPQGRLNSASLQLIEEIIKIIERDYKRL